MSLAGGDESYEFGPFRLDGRGRQLLREGHPVSLKPKAVETLLVLVRRAGSVVDREELIRALWPDTVVTEANLTQHVWMLRKVLGDSDEVPSYIETIPRRGYRFVAPVTRVSPEPIGSLAADPEAPAPREERSRRGPLGLGGLILGTAAALGIGVLLLGGRAPAGREAGAQPSGASLTPRRAVAVLGFKNLSGRQEAAWLSIALGEMLTMELAAGQSLRTVPGESVGRMQVDLGLTGAETLAADTAGRIRTSLGADYVLLGSYVALGAGIRLDVRVQDTATGDVVAAVTGAGTEAELFGLVADVGARLREKLGAGALSPAEAAKVRASFPTSPEAARLYAEGLERLRVFDALVARERLEQAALAEPKAPLIHSALAAAWSALGYDVKAREEARKAFDLSADLSREDRLWVEGRYREMLKEWEKAVEVYTTLWDFFPDNLEYGLRLAAAQTAAGRGKNALVTLEALRRLPVRSGADPRIDLAEADAADSVSDLRLAQAAAAKAADKAHALGSRLLLARARYLEARACWKLRDLDRSRALAVEAQGLFAAAQDRSGVARALDSVANVLWYQGDLDEAKQAYEETLAIGRQIGDEHRVRVALNNVANVLAYQGDLSGAQKAYEESLATAHGIADKAGVATALYNLALVRHRQGHLGEAEQMLQGSLATSREIGDPAVALTLASLAMVLRGQGALARARRTAMESLTVARATGDQAGVGYALYGFGQVLAVEGEVAGARKNLVEALDVHSRCGDKLGGADVRLALAVLSAAEGEPVQAEAAARGAEDDLRKQQRGARAAALATLAQALLAQGRLPEARAAIDEADALSKNSQDLEVRLLVAISSGRVRAASGNATDASRALDALEEALARASKAGLVGLQLEARLALGEIEKESGRAAAGRARLVALEKDARTRGFGLVARRAAR